MKQAACKRLQAAFLKCSIKFVAYFLTLIFRRYGLEWIETQRFLFEVHQLFEQHVKRQQRSSNQFNFFSLFKYESDENIHSDFIAELLRPNGVHGQGAIFLQLFLKQCVPQEQRWHNLQLMKAAVQREYYLGAIDWDEVGGGRVDIRIECQNNIFLIENKIYAGLQQLQLERYLNACTDMKHQVVLLTLDKNDSVLGTAQESLEKKGLIWLTYQEDILPWLEMCKKEMADNNVMREVLNQYLYCLKKLSHEIEDDMSKNDLMIKIMEDTRNLKSFIYLSQIQTNEVFVELNKRVLEQVSHAVEVTFQKKVDVHYVHRVEDCRYLSKDEFYASEKSYLGLNFNHESLQKLNLVIRFEFEKREKISPFIGVCFADGHCGKEISSQQQEVLYQIQNYSHSGSRINRHWLYWTNVFDHPDKKIDFSGWVYEPELLDYLISENKYRNHGFTEDVITFIQVVLAACKTE